MVRIVPEPDLKGDVVPLLGICPDTSPIAIRFAELEDPVLSETEQIVLLHREAGHQILADRLY